MLDRLLKKANEVFTSIASKVEGVISTDPVKIKKTKIDRIVRGFTTKQKSEIVAEYLCGNKEENVLLPDFNFFKVGEKLLEERFRYNDEEMIRFYQLAINNGRTDSILSVFSEEALFVVSRVEKSLDTLGKTSINRVEIVEYLTQTLPFKEYRELFPAFSSFLLPGWEKSVRRAFTNSDSDSKRYIWASLLFHSGEHLDFIKDHLENLSFDQNTNYTLSLLEDADFTKKLILQRSKKWLENRSLDRSGRVVAMLEGDFQFELSENLIKKIRGEFFDLLLKGLQLNHRVDFIKNIVRLGSIIDPVNTLSKLSGSSILKYVEQNHVSLSAAATFFILKGKDNYFKKLLEMDFAKTIKAVSQSEELTISSAPYLWNYDKEKAFDHFIKIAPDSSEKVIALVVSLTKSYEDGYEKIKKLIVSRRVALRKIAAELLPAYDKPEVKTMLEERLKVEKNADVKSKIKEAVDSLKPSSQKTSRVVELIMVSTSNNNKYYRMIDNGDTFDVEWGRVGGRSQTANYEISEWDKKYREKIRKGYVDNSGLFLKKKTSSDYKKIDDKVVKKLVDDLMAYSNKTIFDNYTVTAENVTRKQVDAAQEIIDDLAKRVKVRGNVVKINDALLELYKVIPRKMKNVNDHLYNKKSVAKDDLHELEKILSSEQDKLDAMSSRLRLIELEDEQDNDVKDITILDVMGIKIRQVDKNEEKMIKKMMRSISGRYKRAYCVENSSTQARFESHLAGSQQKNTELYFHGSRNENFLNILQTGLLIRPS